ncbi:hypothetical protein DM860_010365 [Cuscuta australis]|uniref:Uncharacterized protein n=1 Tax=Cuscuta australis TaxID=267555 RepID=A0A328E189_9ASTE|nr:hypothetical protein DM860_010365 [Cuscuta australis]
MLWVIRATWEFHFLCFTDSDFEFLNQSNTTCKEHKEHGLHHGLNGIVVSNGKILSSLQQVDHAVQEISVQKYALRFSLIQLNCQICNYLPFISLSHSFFV